MADLPVGDIIKNITDDVKLLVQDQIELAKTELIPAAKNGEPARGCSESPDTSHSARRFCSISLLPWACTQQAWQAGWRS